jgi:sensor histidine kinase YesM
MLPLYIGWWLFWALCQVLVLHRLGLNWSMAMGDSFISNGLLAIISATAMMIYRYYQPGSTNRLYRLLHGFLISVLYIVALQRLLQTLFFGDSQYQQFLSLSIPLRFMFALLMISFVTILNWLWNNLKEQTVKEERRNQAEQLVKDAELVKLRQQLQPHFLFNSLNSISALAGSKPNEARKMIQQLSDFLRGTLKKDEQKEVLLSEELEHLKLYLEIEKVRFGDRLNLDIHIPENCLPVFLPPLLLQPIVENAIKFGLYGTTESITVSILARLDNSFLYIEIKNPFDSETQRLNEGSGFGLSSIERRLQLLYTRNDLLNIEKAEHEFITKLKIPIRA